MPQPWILPRVGSYQISPLLKSRIPFALLTLALGPVVGIVRNHRPTPFQVTLKDKSVGGLDQKYVQRFFVAKNVISETFEEFTLRIS